MARNNSGNNGRRPIPRAAAKYTIYPVNEPAELMEFLMKKMDGISRTRVKALLANRVVLVDTGLSGKIHDRGEMILAKKVIDHIPVCNARLHECPVSIQ